VSSFRFLPFTDLAGYSGSLAKADLASAFTLIFLAVPQGVAYAMIAGLPPAMGLYAAAIPAVAGSIMRSSRHVVSGPTNAISLLVGGWLAMNSGLGLDPVVVGVTAAFMVGLFQVLAGWLRMGRILDYVSKPVVLGYITGAGILIGIGQLPNLTSTQGGTGNIIQKVSTWAQGLGGASTLAIGTSLGTLLFILLLRKIRRTLPGPMIAMALATALSMVLDFQGMGLKVVKDISPIPAGLPPFSLPDLSLAPQLLSLAFAATILSLVESSAVARAIAGRTGQKLDADVEFAGQGFSNLSAAFVMGYPVSGSLSRSALNERSGGETRVAGALSGLLMFLVLLGLGPLVDHTPISALAGLLMIVAWDLVDRKKIREAMRTGWPDRLTFLATVMGTWALPLDQAIYLGVGISLLAVLRISVREPAKLEYSAEEEHQIPALKTVEAAGFLSFKSESRLRSLLVGASEDPLIKHILLRLENCTGMDYTIATALEEVRSQLESRGSDLYLADCAEGVTNTLRSSGAMEALGAECLLEGGSAEIQRKLMGP
jgi:sulfate permease, SulP family